jgi:hypothetical protein
MCQKWLKSHVFYVLLILLNAFNAQSKMRGGVGLGLGGTGITKQVETEELGITVAEKSEGFGMIHFFVEDIWRMRYVVGLEHSRGFRMGPFSSGVGFTSATFRWHYLRTAPSVSKVDDISSTFFVKRWSPYTGGTAGIAFGEIRREGDKIPRVSSSGVHFGLKNGVDYLYRPNIGLRAEVSYATTFFQAPVFPARMTEFSLWLGIFIPL